MSQRAKTKNQMNHNRQLEYLRKGVVMIPTLREEVKNKKKENN